MLQNIRDGLQKHKWLMYIVLGSLALIFAAALLGEGLSFRLTRIG